MYSNNDGGKSGLLLTMVVTIIDKASKFALIKKKTLFLHSALRESEQFEKDDVEQGKLALELDTTKYCNISMCPQQRSMELVFDSMKQYRYIDNILRNADV